MRRVTTEVSAPLEVRLRDVSLADPGGRKETFDLLLWETVEVGRRQTPKLLECPKRPLRRNHTQQFNVLQFLELLERFEGFDRRSLSGGIPTRERRKLKRGQRPQVAKRCEASHLREMLDRKKAKSSELANGIE